MRGRVTTVLLSLFSAIFGFLMFASPVMAVPADSTPGQSVVQDADDSAETDSADTETNSENTQPSCYDQVGGVGWLICPGTAFLANIIDGAYGIIEELVRVDPLPSDQESPIFVVWSYIRNITNFIFIIFLLVVVYSQLTGLGINNYGIKRILPRLIISAIAVNLSFIICTLAVDLSNIIGGSALGFFDGVLADAIANSQIEGFAGSVSVASIVATILGVGTVATFVAATTLGGMMGVIWALIPIVLAGAVAVISAVITMAARQALIILLSIVSPLAIVCCLLPNTYSWFKKWQNLFISMLVFYPMFSVLYGASRLAGAVIISSATTWLTVVLGVAVEVLPLFFSIPLLRMSNTVLGKVSGAIGRASAPLDRVARNYSNERRAIARQRQLASSSALPHNSLARFLAQRRMDRRVDLREKTARNEDYFYTESTGRRYFKSNGKLNRRGQEHNLITAQRMEYEADRKRYDALFDDGFDEKDYRRPSEARRVAKANRAYASAIKNDSIASAYADSVKLKNLENRARIIQDGMKDPNSEIYAQVIKTFGAENSDQANRAVSAVMSNAVNAKARVDKETKDNYLTLYNNYEPGKDISNDLRKAFDNKDYNATAAAIEVMAIRGDHDQINAILREKTPDLMEETPENLLMRKAIRDVGIKMKAENATFWSYSKANMIRAGMSGAGKEINGFIDFATFMAGETVDGDHDIGAINKTNAFNILQNITDPTVAKGQDRTVYGDLLDMQQAGIIPAQNGNLSTGFSIKQLRTAATLGTMDGEQLEALNHLLTGGINKDNPNMAWVNTNHDAIESNILEFISLMSPSQLAATKTATILSINEALMKLDPSDIRELNGHKLSGKLADAVIEQSASLCRPNAVTDRNRMNPAVREMLGITEITNASGGTKLVGGTQDAVRI